LSADGIRGRVAIEYVIAMTGAFRLQKWLAAAALLLVATVTAAGADEPFVRVRAHQKISATAGGFPGELHERSSFGWGLAGLGVRDGATKIAIGAHFDRDGADRAGSLWIVTLEADGKVRAATKLSALTGGLGARLGRGDVFGLSIAALGDLDGDGEAEIAVGAPGDDDADVDTGAVYILSLASSGHVRWQTKISPRKPWARSAPWTWVIPDAVQGRFFGAVRAGDNFGASVAGIGDLDGDSVPDLAVGVRGDNLDERSRGAVWVLFLRPDGSVERSHRIGSKEGGFDGLLQPNDVFGLALASLGDVDGDGIQDLAVGAPGDDDGCNACGAVWVLFLDRDGRVRKSQKISQRAGGFAGRLNNRSEFGISLAALPDLDGNGVMELVVGARGDSEAGINAGAIWILSLDRNANVLAHQKITSGVGGLPEVLEVGDIFGVGLTSLGDLDGDGWPELGAGAEGDDDGADRAGAAWVLFLGPAKP